MRNSGRDHRPLVLLTDPLVSEVVKAELKPFARVRIPSDRAALLRAMPQADALIACPGHSVDEALLSAAGPKFKAVGNCAVGVDNIDLRACARRGIRVVNTPGVLTRATAELSLALLLAAARRLPEGEALCRSGRFGGWTPRMLRGLDLDGGLAVIVGRGRIGRATARLYRAVGLRIDWATRADSPSKILRKLSCARVVSIHLPLTPETRHWLDARRIAALPRDCIVINTGRGPLVDEAALIRALRRRRIFGAGLDVFEAEPFIPTALRKLPNVVLTPHLGSATIETRRAMSRLAIRGVLELLGLRPFSGSKGPRNEVRFPGIQRRKSRFDGKRKG